MQRDACNAGGAVGLDPPAGRVATKGRLARGRISEVLGSTNHSIGRALPPGRPPALAEAQPSPPGVCSTPVRGGTLESRAHVIDQPAGQPHRLARWCTPHCFATARSRSRVTAKNRPSNRPPRRLSCSSRACQRSRAAADPLQDLGHFTRDRRLPLAEQPAGVVHQQQVVAQREPLEHPLTRRIQPPPVLDRTEPQRLLHARRGRRARHAAVASGFQVGGASLGLHVLDPLLDRGMLAGLRQLARCRPPRGSGRCRRRPSAAPRHRGSPRS